MENKNQMIERPNLNFFQNIRKALLIKNIDKQKFLKAPEYLKNDIDVILALVDKSPYFFDALTMEQKMIALNKREKLFNEIIHDERIEIIKEHPEYIKMMDENEAMNYVIKENRKELIKYLPEELQERLLTEDVKYITKNSGNYGKNNSGTYSTTSIPFNYHNSLEYFDPNVVIKATIKLVEMAKKNDRYAKWEYKRSTVPLLDSMEIENLPVDLQLKLAIIDNEFLKKLSVEAATKYVDNNPMLLKNVSKEAQAEIIKQNPALFGTLGYDQKRKLLESNFELKSIIPDIEKIKMRNSTHDTELYTNTDEIRNEIILNKNNDAAKFAQVTDYVRDAESLLKLAVFEPKVFSMWGLNDNKSYNKMGHCIQIYKNITDDPEILSALETFQLNINKDTLKTNKNTANIAKVLLNKNVIKSVDKSEIAEFIKNPDINKMKDIIIKTYGEHTKEIFEDRPLLEMEHIHNLDIFDKKIIDKFGIGMVHNLLSYDTRGAAVIGELARNPDKMKEFDKFSEIVGDYFDTTPLGIENKLISFMKLEKLIEKIDLNDMTKERKEGLLLAINDRLMTDSENETSIIELNSVEDLDKYKEKRNEIYDDYIKKINSPMEIKEAISRKFFGMTYKTDPTQIYRQTDLSMRDMINYYNLETFTSDERTQSSGIFSQDELDQMEIATIIGKIQDADVLKEIYLELSKEKEKVINPQEFNKTRSKIPMQYSKELIDSLFTIEDAKKRDENGEEGISYELTEDNIELIKLNGADFRMLIHSTGLNNSGLNVPYGEDVDTLWKAFENGCSTISSCVIEPKMLHSCNNNGGTNLGFTSIDPKQIIGMSHHDAHVSHLNGEIDPKFEYSSVQFNYPEELVRKTAAQIKGIELKDTTHEYNEVTMYRRDVDIDKVQSNTHGGRIMPDYIVVYGKAQEKHTKLAKKFAKDGKPIPIIEIDTEAYGVRTYQRAYEKEDHFSEREKGESIKKIEEITKNTDDGR